MRVVTIQIDVKDKYLEEAKQLRELYDKYGVKVYEFLGSPGSGKTTIIEKIANKLGNNVLYIAGDVASSLDAERVAKTGVDVVQINTGGICHLEPQHIFRALENVDLKKYDTMIIENVGNLICPFNFPLGAHKRVMVVSVTEGEDKFVKHPMSTKKADVIVISKIDLADKVGVNVDKMVEDARRLNPRAPIVLVSAKEGIGLEDLINALKG